MVCSISDGDRNSLLDALTVVDYILQLLVEESEVSSSSFLKRRTMFSQILMRSCLCSRMVQASSESLSMLVKCGRDILDKNVVLDRDPPPVVLASWLLQASNAHHR